MCGVAAAVGRDHDRIVTTMTHALRHRGPDDGDLWHGEGVSLGHTRLAIVDPDPRSRCPFVSADGRTTLVYNGEVWNHGRLRTFYGPLRDVSWRTTGDTETVCEVLSANGAAALDAFEGMFGMAWWDDRAEALFVARDRFGEVPLHVTPLGRADSIAPVGMIADGFAVCSELKAMRAAGVMTGHFVDPGTVLRFERLATGRWRMEEFRWYDAPIEPWSGPAVSGFDEREGPVAGNFDEREVAAHNLRAYITNAVSERGVHADVPVCTLLSGGIDSSAVALHLKLVVPNLVAYTAVMDPKAPDLKQARAVADHLEIELVEVQVPIPTAADLLDVVRRIEMPYKAQVEIGWSCLHLARRIQADGFKVAFSGEGADELWASYGFTYHAMKRSDFDWYRYRKELFVGQHRKNFARCNKVFMAHSVECRLPFLHTPLVEFGLSLPEHVVRGPTDKAIMSRAYEGMLPESVLTRKKLAFQDGNGTKRAIQHALAESGEQDPKAFYNRVFKEAYA